MSPIIGPDIMIFPARLHESTRELADAGEKRSKVSPGDTNLQELDQNICLAARGLFVRYVDAVGWFDRPDAVVTQQCRDAIDHALKCMDRDAYPGASDYYDSVLKKLKLMDQIAEGTSIDDVLEGAIAHQKKQSSVDA